MTQIHDNGHNSNMIKQVVDCSTCDALCCRRGTRLPLSETEAAFLGGNDTLVELKAPGKRHFLPIFPVKKGVYRLERDCTRLAENPNGGAPLCSAHDDSSRPYVCGEFQPGAYKCRELRVQAGVDTPEDFVAYLAITGQDTVDTSAFAEVNLPPAAPPTPPMAA